MSSEFRSNVAVLHLYVDVCTQVKISQMGRKNILIHLFQFAFDLNRLLQMLMQNKGISSIN